MSLIDDEDKLEREEAALAYEDDEPPQTATDQLELLEEEEGAGEEEEQQQPEIKELRSGVSASQTKNIFIIGILVFISVIFLYFFIFSGENEKTEEEQAADIIQAQPVEQAQPATEVTGAEQRDITAVEAPQIPDLEEPSLADLTAPPPVATRTEIVDPFQDISLQPDALAPPPVEPSIAPPPPPEPSLAVRAIVPTNTPPAPPPGAPPPPPPPPPTRLGPMILMGGANINPTPQNMLGTSGIPTRTSPTIMATTTHVGNLNYTIAQGKMLYVVLETAVNSDLQGLLRGIVTRDVYAESGSNVLIPKGSRVIGQYATGITRGQRRVLITWNRLITPEGYDMQIDSAGTDQLGRAGSKGIVDNKYFDIFSNAILLSIISVGGSILADAIQGDDNNATSTSSTVTAQGDVTTTTTGGPVDNAITDNVERFNQTAQGVVQGFLDSQPTIIVDQGTRINVFVNKDLVFPPEAVRGGVTFIQ